MEGEVLSAGPGKMMADGKRSPMDIKAGDRVLFRKYAGAEIEEDLESPAMPQGGGMGDMY